MVWFRKEKNPKTPVSNRKLAIPDGLWAKCDNCKKLVYKKEIERSWKVCPKCDYHFRISAAERLSMLFDNSQYQEFDQNLTPNDPLKFKDSVKYKDRVKKTIAKTNMKEAVLSCQGTIEGMPLIACTFEFAFMGGSMSSVVGEKIVRAIDRAIEKKCAFMTIASSGGARMQEGILSLMQMAKTAAATTKLSEQGLVFISLLTDPTMGGVSASFAMLGDIILAEPKALIGFAGPRVIEQAIGKALPEGFQRAEFLYEHGMIDKIVNRKEMRATLAEILTFFSPPPSNGYNYVI
jgi:acetyl-CoA carboxylase carboxyl transferase subunit beta